MKIILLEKVANIGNLGDIAEVRPGYARNYLFPKGKAERATSRVIADFEERREELQKRADEYQQKIEKSRNTLRSYTLTLAARASADGNLYGSITPTAIATALNAEKLLDIEFRRNQLSLPNGNIKEIGKHQVIAVLDAGVEAKFTVLVVSENDMLEQNSSTSKGKAS